MNRELQEQLEFLQLQENDTIVDIGASSGSFNASMAAIAQVKSLHFLLVDIDTACLNSRTIANVINHYTTLRGAPLTAGFQFVQNTPDSLWLPLNRYRKVWMMNVLHEIPDMTKMTIDVAAIMRTGGELVLLELIPRKKGQLHGGCKMPLRTVNEWKELVESSGLQFVEHLVVEKNRGKTKLALMRFVKR